MRIQSSHAHDDRGLDPYFTPPEATWSLLAIEGSNIPEVIWEPAAGDGAIVKVLEAAGRIVLASDVADYGAEFELRDYLTAPLPGGVGGIITNPPYRLAVPFLEKALREVGYVALLLRTNFLESTRRMPFFLKSPPSRLWISARRLPMMHRYGWNGPRAPSNTCHGWFVWDNASGDRGRICWFDWAEYV